MVIWFLVHRPHQITSFYFWLHFIPVAQIVVSKFQEAIHFEIYHQNFSVMSKELRGPQRQREG